MSDVINQEKLCHLKLLLDLIDKILVPYLGSNFSLLNLKLLVVLRYEYIHTTYYMLH